MFLSEISSAEICHFIAQSISKDRSADQYYWRYIIQAVWFMLVPACYYHIIPMLLFSVLTGAILILKFSSIIFSLPKLNQTVNDVILPDKSRLTTQNSKRVKVLSFNFYLRAGLVSDMNGDYKDQRMDDFLKHYIQNYDILVFQEVFSTLVTRRNRLVKEAYKLGFRYSTAGPSPDLFSFKMFDSGLLILSRYEIVDSEFEEFAHDCHVDSCANKGIIYAKIQLNPDSPSDTIHLFNTHLQASYSVKDALAQKTQLQQLSQLKRFIKRKTDGEVGISVVCGDFNLDALESPPTMYQEMRQIMEGFEDLFYKQHGKHIPTCTSTFDQDGGDVGTRRRSEEEMQEKNYYHLHQCIDYQLYARLSDCTSIKHVHTSEPLPKLVDDNPFGRISDHDALCSTFEFM